MNSNNSTSEGDMTRRIYVLDHSIKALSSRLDGQQTDFEKLKAKVGDMNAMLHDTKRDVATYSSHQGEAIKSLQETVTALRELTAELKQDSKLQEKSINAMVTQMQAMNGSMVDMSKTIHKFLYIGSGIVVTLSLISNGTIGSLLSVLGG